MCIAQKCLIGEWKDPIPVKQIVRALVGWLHEDTVANSVSQTKKASEPGHAIPTMINVLDSDPFTPEVGYFR